MNLSSININVIFSLIGILAVVVVILLFFLFRKGKPEEVEKKPSLKTLKSYVKDAHNNLVEAADNLNKLYEIFNDIENG